MGIVVSAVADYAILTVLRLAVQAMEEPKVDSDGVGLSASLADVVTANGGETLRGVPTGIWTIPVAELPTLELTPPNNWIGAGSTFKRDACD
jgi:hypothetical protein